MKIITGIISVALVLTMPTLCLADWEEDLYKAQRCFNKTPSIRCIDPIRRYNNVPVNRLKCGIRIYDQGVRNFPFDFPLFFDAPGQAYWPVMFEALSQKDLREGDARSIRHDCQGVGSDLRYLFLKILGEHYWLLFQTLEVSSIRYPALNDQLGSIRDPNTMWHIGESAERIGRFCDQYRPNAPGRRWSLCNEPLRVLDYPGSSSFDRLVYSVGSFDKEYKSATASTIRSDVCENLQESNSRVTSARNLAGPTTCLEEFSFLATEENSDDRGDRDADWIIDLPVGEFTKRVTLFNDETEKKFRVCRKKDKTKSKAEATLALYILGSPTVYLKESECTNGESKRVRLRGIKMIEDVPIARIMSGSKEIEVVPKNRTVL